MKEITTFEFFEESYDLMTLFQHCPMAFWTIKFKQFPLKLQIASDL